MSPVVLAHLAPGYQASGFSPGLVIYLTIAGLVVMALALRVTWPSPRFGPLAAADQPVTGAQSDRGPASAELDGWPGQNLPVAALVAFRGLGLFGLAFLLLCGWAGSPQIGVNPLWIAMFSVFWIGGQLLSLLIGDWWRLIDPFDTIAGWISPGPAAAEPGAEGDGHAVGDEERRDWWVPGALLVSFTWMWLAWEGGKPEIRPNAAWLTAYLALMAAGAAVGGRAWVRRNEAFAVAFGLVASISPVDWSGPRPRLRNPLVRNAEHRVTKREAAVLAVMAGTVLFDAIGSTRWWADFVGTRSIDGLTAFSTVGIVWLTISAGVAWVAASRLAGLAAGEGGRRDTWALAGPLAGTAAGFAVAHEFNALLTNVQSFLALLSDPLARGWNLIGTIRIVTNPYLLSAGAQAWVSLGIIEVAVLVSYLGLHDRCVARFGLAGTRATWAALGFMLLASVVGLKLLVGV